MGQKIVVLALLLSLTGCGSLHRAGTCLDRLWIATEPVGALIMGGTVVVCVASLPIADAVRAKATPPLPAPLAEHPPITATSRAPHDDH